jgi:murein DD-endopeptidase MepM/ murein hydrolase activator NlpD
LRLSGSAVGSTRPLIGLKPSGSGGVSWPERPSYGDERHTPGSGSWSADTWSWPAQGVFSSGYGWRWGRMHKGIDVANAEGTPIMAARNGKVTFADWHDGGYGYLVEITHPDGTITRYAHNSRLMVREGQYVQQGEVVSLMGSTGRSTGPHLHFELRPPGQGAVNPLDYVRRPV